MTEFDCQETKRHVHEYLLKELGEAEMSEITSHLAHCESCEEDYDFEAVFNSAIQRSCTEDPPQDLANRVLQKLRDLQKEHFGDPQAQ